MTTTTPIEGRMHRFSEQAVGDYAQVSADALARGGPGSLAAYLAQLERTTRVRGALFGADGHEIAGQGLPGEAAGLAARARVTQRTELGADHLTAMKARAVSLPGGADYVFVAAVPIGSLRLLRDAP